MGRESMAAAMRKWLVQELEAGIRLASCEACGQVCPADPRRPECGARTALLDREDVCRD